jgi:hypothetical protein
MRQEVLFDNFQELYVAFYHKFPAICNGFFKFAKLCLHYCILACVVICMYAHACMHVWEGELSERNTHRAESTSYNLIWMHKPTWKVSMHNRKWILLLSNCVRCPLSAAIHRLFSTDDFGFGDELTYKQLDSRLLNNDFCPMWIMCWLYDW